MDAEAQYGGINRGELEDESVAARGTELRRAVPMNKLLFPCLLAVLTSSLALETDAILKERLESTQSAAIEGAEGWRFLPAEIKHLLAGDPSADPKKPLEAIVDLSGQLKHLGVRLIVVPVPAKATVHPEFLDARLKGETVVAPEAGFYESLRGKGVEVLDLTAEFANAKAKGPVYCARDTHWNGNAIALAARKLARNGARSHPENPGPSMPRKGRWKFKATSAATRKNSSCALCARRARPDALNRTGRVRFSCWATAIFLFSTMGGTCMLRAPACPTNSPLNFAHRWTCSRCAVGRDLRPDKLGAPRSGKLGLPRRQRK